MWVDHTSENNNNTVDREAIRHMATVAKANNSNFKPVPAGTHLARCIAVIDLGTRMDSYQGQDPKPRHTVHIRWELPDETYEDMDGNQRPSVVGNTYGLSIAKKSKLGAHLISWRGRQFTADEEKAFELKNILGAPCMLTIVHKSKENGDGVSASVASVTAPPKGVKCPAQVNKSLLYEVEDGRNEVFEGLPEWLQQLISESLEFTELEQQEPEPDSAGADPDEEPCPF